MLRAIRGLAVAGLVFVALAAWMVYANVVNVFIVANVVVVASRRDIRDIVEYVPLLALTTGTLLSFCAGVLALALSIPQRRRGWSVALTASLILNGYWPWYYHAFWSMAFAPPFNAASSPLLRTVSVVTYYGLAPAAPALLALAYTFRSARSSPQAAHAAEEDGSLDISTEPLGDDER